MELYRKVIINRPDDLPKESGYYPIMRKRASIMDIMYLSIHTVGWLGWQDIDWYLLPEEQEPQKEVADEDRVYFTDNMKFLEILTMWCNIHDFSFSGKESSIITSAVNEYMSQFTTQRQVTDEEIEIWANDVMNKSYYYNNNPNEKFTSEWHDIKIALVKGAKAMRDNKIKRVRDKQQ